MCVQLLQVPDSFSQRIVGLLEPGVGGLKVSDLLFKLGDTTSFGFMLTGDGSALGIGGFHPTIFPGGASIVEVRVLDNTAPLAQHCVEAGVTCTQRGKEIERVFHRRKVCLVVTLS